MFNSCKYKTNTYKRYLTSSRGLNKFYRPQPILSFHLHKDIFVHTGMSLIWRYNLPLFLSRQIKYNVFFKKPLVRPVKRKKK